MNRKEQIRTLWQTCFNDTDASLDLFFDRVYKDENAVSIEKDGHVVSVLQMLPYQMRWCGTEIPVSYIYAACTAPEERGKGLMHDLLINAFAAMRQRGILFTLLIPANPGLFTYYRGQGYTEVFDYSVETYTAASVADAEDAGTCVPVDEQNAGDWYPYFRTKEEERPLSVLHSENDFRYLIGDILLNDGLVLGLQDKSGQKTGIAFASEDEEGMCIRELMYETDSARRQLIRETLARLGLTSINHLAPPRLPDSQRCGMGIILNPTEMIRLWAAHHHPSPETIHQLESMDIRELTDLLIDYQHRTGILSLMPD